MLITSSWPSRYHLSNDILVKYIVLSEKHMNWFRFSNVTFLWHCIRCHLLLWLIPGIVGYASQETAVEQSNGEAAQVTEEVEPAGQEEQQSVDEVAMHPEVGTTEKAEEDVPPAEVSISQHFSCISCFLYYLHEQNSYL